MNNPDAEHRGIARLVRATRKAIIDFFESAYSSFPDLEHIS